MFELRETDFREAVETLQTLLRFDTTNPPGNERPAAEYVARLLRDEGLTPELVGSDPERPNVVAKLACDPAHRKARPLVLSCHLDVVPADPERWTHPPFSGVEEDGFIWGRGAIDMKGFAVMGLTILRLLKRRETILDRDIIFAAVADEEAGTDFGSKWLVENRPDLLGGDPEYIINEVGGFTLHREGKRFYPVQVAEKGVAWLRMITTGKPGHSSLPARGNALEVLSEAVTKISKATLPFHISEPAKRFLKTFADESGLANRLFSSLLLNPVTGPGILKRFVPKDRRANVEALLRNTANPTVIQASRKINVIPAKASAEIDGRLAPGQTANDLIKELQVVIGDSRGERFEFEILNESPAVEFDHDTALFETICETLKKKDPGCIPVPSMIPGFTDSSNYAKLGAICYGFYPVQLPEDLDFAAMFHGDDERIPTEGFRWGIETLFETVSQFCSAR